MLSKTYTITDIKAELENTYDYYGYTSDTVFVDAIERVCEDVKRRILIPRIGEYEYDRIENKDKKNLTQTEEAIYWAEIFFTCHAFLKWKFVAVDEQTGITSGSGESLSVEGYSYSSKSTGGAGAGSSESSGSGARGVFYKRACEYMTIAGYPMSSLSRGSSIYA